ncbi:hypothetical protein J2T10_003014 [Paenarthrobacter nicotinovorans]|uniref:Integral membrane protein n=1 Tax=Paenarthrobacter nicotinovorans TaxID=29320 RepID=A0ABT9TPN9_PAENI|nr:hypothetical protein [Paenarthrobacter nicotinovorans]MDQ0103350.1 hypothetical protein [Paenarthrobacter nicotinovorans]GAT86593.1 hypothetical protein CVCC1112_1252 [Paenarthrobacter nicotinovorans]
MNDTTGGPSAAEARELLAKAEAISATSTTAAAWPVAVTFTSLAIIGSLLMIGMHIVLVTGYGAALLAISVGAWAAITASVWPMFQRSTKAGYTRRFLTSLFAYFALYIVALVVGASFFRDGNLWFYLPAAIALGAVGLAAAFRELRA